MKFLLGKERTKQQLLDRSRPTHHETPAEGPSPRSTYSIAPFFVSAISLLDSKEASLSERHEANHAKTKPETSSAKTKRRN